MDAQLSYRDSPPKLVAGVRCVDFINTVEWRGDPAAREERLAGYDEFLVWAAAAGLVDEAGRHRLAADAASRPGVARKVLAEAIALREALAGVLSGGYLADLNAALGKLRFSYRLEPSPEGGLRAVATSEVDALRVPVAQLAHEIIEFLASDRRAQIGHCADHRCGWFFVDTSRNHSRMWCAMADCGNNAKARAFYQRKRSVQVN